MIFYFILLAFEGGIFAQTLPSDVRRIDIKNMFGNVMVVKATDVSIHFSISLSDARVVLKSDYDSAAGVMQYTVVTPGSNTKVSAALGTHSMAMYTASALAISTLSRGRSLLAIMTIASGALLSTPAFAVLIVEVVVTMPADSCYHTEFFDGTTSIVYDTSCAPINLQNFTAPSNFTAPKSQDGDWAPVSIAETDPVFNLPL